MTGESSTSVDKFRGYMKLFVRLSKDSKESYCVMFMEIYITDSSLQVGRQSQKLTNRP